MVTTFAPNAHRDAAAAEIVKGAGSWLRITLRETRGAFKAGSRFYGVPSSSADGRYYLTNLRYCSCPDYDKRGQGCKHQRAVASHVAAVAQAKQEAASAASTTPTTWKACAGRCGELLAPEHLGRHCNACSERNRRLLASMETQDIG